LRDSGDVVHVLLLLGEMERADRVGEKAVLRRRRELDELRRGVNDWKRLVRDGEGILNVVVVVVVD